MIYFARRESDGAIKIGCTCRTPQDRMNSLALEHGPMSLFGVLPGSFKEERAMHDKLDEHRIVGEWFRPTAAVMNEAAAVVPFEQSRELRPSWQDIAVEVQFALRLPQEVHDKLVKKAEAERRSVNAQIVRAVEKDVAAK